jgi:nicotinamide-nucleotide adenylyltransferase
MEKTTALFIGRFQPFHNGHLKAIEWILKKCPRIVIVIGSAQFGNMLENPFTAGEREEMIRRALGKFKGRFEIVPVPDIGDNSRWVGHVDEFVPHYDIVFTNSALTKRLFSAKGRKVRRTPFFERNKWEGTSIRKAMVKGKEWEEDVPEEVRGYLEKIKGVERVMSILE